jgi:hypothetical protein
MKLTFLFLVLIIGIWLASTTFGRLFEGMKDGAKKVVVKPVHTKKTSKGAGKDKKMAMELSSPSSEMT